MCCNRQPRVYLAKIILPPFTKLWLLFFSIRSQIIMATLFCLDVPHTIFYLNYPLIYTKNSLDLHTSLPCIYKRIIQKNHTWLTHFSTIKIFINLLLKPLRLSIRQTQCWSKCKGIWLLFWQPTSSSNSKFGEDTHKSKALKYMLNILPPPVEYD